MNRLESGAACGRLLVAVALTLSLTLSVASAQNLRKGLGPQQENNLAQKHDGYYGALAPQNLAKPRPKPPFNLTGTWFINLRHAFSDFMFGPPYPQFYKAGQQAMKLAAAARKAHKSFRDASGKCWPIGMPMILTRVWPIDIIQMPTAVFMIDGFFDSLRVIYTDGRKHTPFEVSVDTYNGESIGHWTKDALIVDTRYFATDHHYIDMGIPISEKLHIVERITLADHGHTLVDQFTMTDPDMWKGEWKSTKRWIREDESDIPENECLPSTDEYLPSTAQGHAEAEKESHVKVAAPK
ncbi:MAG: hypothetical protein ACREU3_11825 [Steroidobacteraceae bacterium]